jgi:hypothetical protein
LRIGTARLLRQVPRQLLHHALAPPCLGPATGPPLLRTIPGLRPWTCRQPDDSGVTPAARCRLRAGSSACRRSLADGSRLALGLALNSEGIKRGTPGVGQSILARDGARNSPRNPRRFPGRICRPSPRLRPGR